MVNKVVENYAIINTREMKLARLENLESFLATERASEQPAKKYIDDLNMSIKAIKQSLG